VQPTGFAAAFFFVTAQPCSHDTGSAQIPYEVLRVVTPYNRQATDVVMHHPRDGVMKYFIRIRDDQMSAAGFEHGAAI
jgi:hypothetical protein